MAGQVDTLITSTAAAMPLIKGGKLKVIAVTSLQRLDLLPEQFASWLADQSADWGKLIREGGIKPE